MPGCGPGHATTPPAAPMFSAMRRPAAIIHECTHHHRPPARCASVACARRPPACARWCALPHMAHRCWCCSTRMSSAKPKTAWPCCACRWRTARSSLASASHLMSCRRCCIEQGGTLGCSIRTCRQRPRHWPQHRQPALRCGWLCSMPRGARACACCSNIRPWPPCPGWRWTSLRPPATARSERRGGLTKSRHWRPPSRPWPSLRARPSTPLPCSMRSATSSHRWQPGSGLADLGRRCEPHQAATWRISPRPLTIVNLDCAHVIRRGGLRLDMRLLSNLGPIASRPKALAEVRDTLSVAPPRQTWRPAGRGRSRSSRRRAPGAGPSAPARRRQWCAPARCPRWPR